MATVWVHTSLMPCTTAATSHCLQDMMSGLPVERSAESNEAAADPTTALSSPRQGSAAAGGGGNADTPGPSTVYAESEAAGSSTGSGSKPRGGRGLGGGGINNNRQREEDYFGVCHTDVVKCIVITDNGKIFTAG